MNLEKAIGKKRYARIKEARERARKDFRAKRSAARAAGKSVPTSYKSSETLVGGKVVKKSSEVNGNMSNKPMKPKKSREYNRAVAQRALAKLRGKKK